MTEMPSDAPRQPEAAEPMDENAGSMQDQLQKDVASWREGRSDGATRAASELNVAVRQSIVPPTNARIRRAKPAAPDPKIVPARGKPFGMSYDGSSRAEYIKLMISRGAR